MTFRKILLIVLTVYVLFIAVLTARIGSADQAVNNIYEARNEVIVEINLLWENKEEWCYEIVGEEGVFCFHKYTRGGEG